MICKSASIQIEVETCRSCGLQHKNVEARGIWHCPNWLCNSSGAYCWKRRLKSYKENEDGTFSIDWKEAIEKAERDIGTVQDQIIKETILKSIKAAKKELKNENF